MTINGETLRGYEMPDHYWTGSFLGGEMPYRTRRRRSRRMWIDGEWLEDFMGRLRMWEAEISLAEGTSPHPEFTRQWLERKREEDAHQN